MTVNKPDFAATDGGCNTFFLPPVSDGCYRFYGTSAAAPHAAAVGALMMHRANQIGAALRQSDAETILQNTARTVSGGSTTSVGAGLIDATAALSQVVASPFHAYLPTVAFSATAASTPQPGYWPSTTFEEFYVDTTGTLVKNFAVYVNVGGCGDYKITHTKAETITNNAFAFTGTFYASGAFDSTTTAHGTNGLSSFPIAGCGNVTGGPWLWTAEWHDSSQPAVVNAMLTRPDGIATPITVTLSPDSTSLRKQSPPVLCYWSNTVESETQGVCEVNYHFA